MMSSLFVHLLVLVCHDSHGVLPVSRYFLILIGHYLRSLFLFEFSVVKVTQRLDKFLVHFIELSFIVLQLLFPVSKLSIFSVLSLLLLERESLERNLLQAGFLNIVYYIHV